MILFTVILAVAFAACGVLLAVSNPGSTAVDYIPGQTEIPTARLVFGGRCVGALIGAAVAAVRRVFRARQGRCKSGHAPGLSRAGT